MDKNDKYCQFFLQSDNVLLREKDPFCFCTQYLNLFEQLIKKGRVVAGSAFFLKKGMLI